MSEPEQVIAHVKLLRAVDRLLEAAEKLRQCRDSLDQALKQGVRDER